MIKAKSLATAVLATASALVLAAAPALGATALQYTEIPFSPTEVSTNWVADRATPSGGYESVTFGDRTNVLEIRIDADNQSSGSNFYYTEGLQRTIPDSDAVKVDLYIDPAWFSSDVPVRAGLWGVGHDGTGAVTAYPIVEFTTMGASGFVGWRTWDGILGGWTNQSQLTFTTGGWSTLEIFHSAETNEFSMTVNGTVAQSYAAGDSVTLGAVILNQYNSGSSGQDYTVHWSRLATGDLISFAASKDECVDGGWAGYGFKNQGQCIASLVAADGATG